MLGTPTARSFPWGKEGLPQGTYIEDSGKVNGLGEYIIRFQSEVLFSFECSWKEIAYIGHMGHCRVQNRPYLTLVRTSIITCMTWCWNLRAFFSF